MSCYYSNVLTQNYYLKGLLSVSICFLSLTASPGPAAGALAVYSSILRSMESWKVTLNMETQDGCSTVKSLVRPLFVVFPAFSAPLFCNTSVELWLNALPLPSAPPGCLPLLGLQYVLELDALSTDCEWSSLSDGSTGKLKFPWANSSNRVSVEDLPWMLLWL